MASSSAGLYYPLGAPVPHDIHAALCSPDGGRPLRSLGDTSDHALLLGTAASVLLALIAIICEQTKAK